MKAKRIFPVVSIFPVLFLTGMFSMSGSSYQESPVVFRGGALPLKTELLLSNMNRHLQNAVTIVRAEPKRIVLIDSDNVTREYLLKNGILWADMDPLIAGVSFMHFEYRDSYGNLIYRPSKAVDTIEAVAYTLKLGIENREIFAHYRTPLTKSRRTADSRIALLF